MSYLFGNPKLNSSIIFKINEHSILVRDTETMNTFSIGDREFEILKCLNGDLNLYQLKTKLSSVIDGKQLEKFLLLIQSNGLLEKDHSLKSKSNIFQMKKPLVKDFNFIKKGDLSKWLTRLILSGPFIAIICTFLFLRESLVSIVSNTLMTNYFRLETVPFYLLSIFILGFLHESAHAITIINAGGNVFEMGFILNHFHPAFYVDITGVSRIKDKNKRLVVWIAGLCVQLLILGPTLCLTYLPQSYLYQNYFLMVFNAVNMGMILFNILFLIKLDGYYILCEFLEITDLKERSLAYLSQPKLPTAKNVNFLYLIVGLAYKMYIPLFIVNFFVFVIVNNIPQMADNLSILMTISIPVSVALKYILEKNKMKGEYDGGFIRV